MNEQHIRKLLARLALACSRFDFGEECLDIWNKGRDCIEKKFRCEIFLSDFRPSGFIQTEQPVTMLTIVPTEIE